MKKLLAVAALGALTLSAPAHAQSAGGGVPSAIGGGLTVGAAVAIGAVVLILAVAISNDDDNPTTITTTTR